MTKISPDAREMNELWQQAQSGDKQATQELKETLTADYQRQADEHNKQFSPREKSILQDRTNELTEQEKKKIENRWTNLYNKK